MSDITPQRLAEIEARVKAAKRMDWQQVVLNGGPPCFHLDEDGSFCGRAYRWEGHFGDSKFPPLHEYVPLVNTLNVSDLIAALRDAWATIETMKDDADDAAREADLND